MTIDEEKLPLETRELLRQLVQEALPKAVETTRTDEPPTTVVTTANTAAPVTNATTTATSPPYQQLLDQMDVLKSKAEHVQRLLEEKPAVVLQTDPFPSGANVDIQLSDSTANVQFKMEMLTVIHHELAQLAQELRVFFRTDRVGSLMILSSVEVTHSGKRNVGWRCRTLSCWIGNRRVSRESKSYPRKRISRWKPNYSN